MAKETSSPHQNHHRVNASLSSYSAGAVKTVLLLRDDDVVLLQHRDDKPGFRHAGMWVPPGGQFEPSESIEACARRGLREETGHECDELNWLASFEDDPHE